MRRPQQWILYLTLSIILSGIAFSQDGKVDTRRWSMHYWQKMAEQGLVEVASDIPAPAARYTGSRINARTVLIDDSPDVAVIEGAYTQSENSIFVNPLDNNKVLNSNNSTNFPVSILYGTSGFFTTDGGATWNGSPQGTGGSNSGDPAAAIDLNGRYYVGYITNSFGQGVARSTDEGQTWTHATVSSSSNTDKNHLWVDNSPTSPYAANLYAAWTDFNNSDIVLSRSTNGGVNWSGAINISSGVASGSHDQGVNVQTGPNGEVYAVWAIYDAFPADENALGFAKSTDGGVSFATATRIISNIRGVRNTTAGKNHRVNAFPSMAVDISGGSRNGWIYIVWPNVGVPGINTGTSVDVYMIRSTDNGANWSTPVQVNQDTTGFGKKHYHPWITCDPVTGALSVIFYDDRNVGAAQCEVFVANSVDGGVTWEDFKVSDVSFTPTPIPGLAGGYMGDYLGISARGGKVYPCWTDTRSGHALTYVSPFIADLTIPNPPADFSAYSDYTMATSMQLTWTNPTVLLNGDPLTPDAFSIVIHRNGVYVDSIPGINSDYTDTGLNDGQEYTYEIYAVVDSSGKASDAISAAWIAGGSPIPNPPANFSVGGGQGEVTVFWTSPTANIDGTPMDDYAGVNLYQNGTLIATFTRSSADTGLADSDTYTVSPPGYYDWHITTVDNESPANESDPTAALGTPLNVPLEDKFEIAGAPNPGVWINAGAEVNDRADTPPSAPYALNLNGHPNGGDILDLKPIDLSSMGGSGIALTYSYQPQGSGNAPEPQDSLQIYFKNDAGDWILVKSYPGTTNQPFIQEVIDIETAPNGGSSYFHGQFQIRFRSSGSAGTFPNDDWFVDDLSLNIPVGIADIPNLPLEFAIKQNYPNPFNPTTTIDYQLSQAAEVKLEIYNVLGQKVRTLVNARMAAGRYQATWDARNDAGIPVGSGVYIYRFWAKPSLAGQAADYKSVQKMVLMK